MNKWTRTELLRLAWTARVSVRDHSAEIKPCVTELQREGMIEGDGLSQGPIELVFDKTVAASGARSYGIAKTFVTRYYLKRWLRGDMANEPPTV